MSSDPATALTLVSHHLCPYVQRAAIALAQRASVKAAVAADYPERLLDFLDKRKGVMSARVAPLRLAPATV